MPPPTQQTGTEALCFRVVRLLLHAVPGRGIFQSNCRQEIAVLLFLCQLLADKRLQVRVDSPGS